MRNNTKTSMHSPTQKASVLYQYVGNWVIIRLETFRQARRIDQGNTNISPRAKNGEVEECIGLFCKTIKLTAPEPKVFSSRQRNVDSNDFSGE